MVVNINVLTFVRKEALEAQGIPNHNSTHTSFQVNQVQRVKVSQLNKAVKTAALTSYTIAVLKQLFL